MFTKESKLPRCSKIDISFQKPFHYFNWSIFKIQHRLPKEIHLIEINYWSEKEKFFFNLENAILNSTHCWKNPKFFIFSSAIEIFKENRHHNSFFFKSSCKKFSFLSSLVISYFRSLIDIFLRVIPYWMLST